MRLDRQWPAWHQEQELKAEHLLGLEDYLVARSAIFVDDNAHGVDLFDWSRLRFEVRGEALVLTVNRLQGITPAGEPVCLTSGEDLVTEVSLLQEGQGSGPLPLLLRPLFIDVSIEVNPPAPKRRANDDDAATAGDLEPAPLPAKFALRGTRVSWGESTPLQPTAQPHSLYLGRYRCVPDERGTSYVPDLLHQPIVRRFGGLQPFDEQWQTWVEPLRSRIEGLATQAQSNGLGQSVVGALLATEILRLSFDWIALPLPLLHRRLHFIRWLSERQMAPANLMDVQKALPVFPPVDADDFSGPALPQLFATLLPDAVETPDNASTSLTDAVSVLVRALVASDIDYYAPTAAFETWVTELRSTGRGGSVRSTYEALLADISGLGPPIAQSPWCAAVLIVTAAVMEATSGQPFPRGTVEPYRRVTTTMAAEAARLLSDIYPKEAALRRAGPLAFYWLARAASDVGELVNACSSDVATYLARLQGRSATADHPTKRVGAAGRAALPTRGRSDRVLNHLVSVQQADTAPAASVSAMSWIERPRDVSRERTSRRTAPIRPQGIQVTLIGPRGSGKSALLRQLCSTPSLALPVRLNQLSAPSGDGVLVTEGTVSLASGAVALRVLDVAGALLDAGDAVRATSAESRPLYAALRDSQLVIITIDPESIAVRQTVDQLAQIAGWITQQTSALIALVYTKADEYGVIAQQELRFVSEQKGVDLRQALSGSIAAWEKLAGTASPSGGESKRVGGVIMGTAGTSTAAGESSPTRSWLLKNTNVLWTGIGGPDPSRLLNAYFVCAEPHDPRFRRTEDRGFVQLFADFFSQFEGRP